MVIDVRLFGALTALCIAMWTPAQAYAQEDDNIARYRILEYRVYELEQKVEKLEKLRSAFDTFSPLDRIEFFTVDDAKRTDDKNSANWIVSCPDGSKVISGYCAIAGLPHGPNVNIQNFGATGNSWHCLWRDDAPNVKVVALCARPKR